jgi:pSer/pThr/pTyr-binding forkhead associated (FHA) protein
MGNEDRRGGIGFGNQRGAPRPEDQEGAEKTRAMDVDDFVPPPTEFVRSAPPPPPAQRPSRPMPMAPRPRPATPAPPPPPPEEEDQATRMLDAVDFDPTPARAPVAPPARPMELRVVSGPDRGKIHRIEVGQSLVGRGLDCKIVLADPAVSRKHFKIERTPDEAVLHDLGGANGTNINGSKQARKVLEPGDQIEVGTSVLEFHIEGQVARKRGAAPVVTGREAAAPSGKSNLPIILAIAAVVLVVLVGGGIAAWLVLGKSSSGTAAKAVAAGEGSEADAMVAKAKGQIADKAFAEAADTLRAAKQADPENQEVKDLLKVAQREVDAQETLDGAREAVKGKRYLEAFSQFAEVPESSALSADAQEELTAAREEFVSSKLADARKAQEAGDNATAIAALDAVLAVDPKHNEAKTLRAGLSAPEAAGGADAAAPAAAPDTKGKPSEAAVPAPAVAAKAGKETAKETVKETPKAAKEPEKVAKEPAKAAAVVAAPAAVAVAAGGKKADFAMGLAAYHGKNWATAIEQFEAIANGPFAKDQKAKASAYAAAVKSVRDELDTASGASSSPRKAAGAYKAAYNADRRVDGAHGGWLAGKIADAYLAVAKASFAGKNYADAADAVREAMNYQPDKPEAVQLEGRCVAQASSMLKEAKDNMSKKNYAAARDLARQVVRILPSIDPRAAEAQDIAKQATEAARQDED